MASMSKAISKLCPPSATTDIPQLQSPNSIDAPLADREGKLTVFYDGSCPLCTAEMGVYRNCAGTDGLAFVDVSAQGPGPVAPGLDKAAALRRFHVLAADGRLASGAEGFGRLWLALPGWRWLGRLVLLPGMLQATELVYRGFLIVRPALQRLWRAKASRGARI